MKRYLEELISRTPKGKMILLAGPRQVGKTTLARKLFPDYEYFNWDNLDHKQIIISRSWSKRTPGVIFDEIHKMPKWKVWLKGIYDIDKEHQQFVVTGSARLNIFKRVGDSLAGRFFGFTLHPFDLTEGLTVFPSEDSDELLNRLSRVGGFPEPFINGDLEFYRMWRRSHLDIILRQDLITISLVNQIAKVELLIEHLRSSVGSPISFKAISEDLQVSDNTVRSWVNLLEELYLIYRLKPFSKNVKRAVIKSPKIYFYDSALVNSGEGGRFENIVANALLKRVDYLNESGKGHYELRFLRNRDGDEIDFLITNEHKPSVMVEAKVSEEVPSKHFKSLGSQFDKIKAIQVVRDLQNERDYPFGVSVQKASKFLLLSDLL